MKQVAISFGLLITALMVLFTLAHYHHLYIYRDDSAYDVWVAVISILFLLTGIFLSRKMFRKTVIIRDDKPATISNEQLSKFGISKREAEVLLLIQQGLSNQQIADKLFLSENTIKKHISNIFLKLNVERRTEAIKRAQELSATT